MVTHDLSAFTFSILLITYNMSKVTFSLHIITYNMSKVTFSMCSRSEPLEGSLCKSPDSLGRERPRALQTLAPGTASSQGGL